MSNMSSLSTSPTSSFPSTTPLSHPCAFIITSSEGVPIAYSEEALSIATAAQISRCVSIALATLHIDPEGEVFELDLDRYQCRCLSVYLRGKYCLIILLTITSSSNADDVEDSDGNNNNSCSNNSNAALSIIPIRSANIALYMVSNWISGLFHPFFHHIVAKLTEYSFRNVESSTFASSVEDKAEKFNCNSELFWGSVCGEQFQDIIVDCLRVFKDAAAKLLHDLVCIDNFWFSPLLSSQSKSVPLVYLFSCNQKNPRLNQIVYASRDYISSYNQDLFPSVESELSQLIPRYLEELKLSAQAGSNIDRSYCSSSGGGDGSGGDAADENNYVNYSHSDNDSPTSSPASRSKQSSKTTKLELEVEKMNASMRAFKLNSDSSTPNCALAGSVVVLARIADLVVSTVFLSFSNTNGHSKSSSGVGGGVTGISPSADVDPHSKYLIRSYGLNKHISKVNESSSGSSNSSGKYVPGILSIKSVCIYSVEILGTDVIKDLSAVNLAICKAISRDADHIIEEEDDELSQLSKGNFMTTIAVNTSEVPAAVKLNGTRDAVSLTVSGSSGKLIKSSSQSQNYVLEDLGDGVEEDHKGSSTNAVKMTSNVNDKKDVSIGRSFGSSCSSTSFSLSANNQNAKIVPISKLLGSLRFEDCLIWMSDARLVEEVLFCKELLK